MAEHTDPAVRADRIARAALALVGAILAAMLLAWLAWRHWRPNGPNSEPAVAVQGPLLEGAPQPALAAFQREQREQRERWGWVEGEPGVARIPLSAAMRLLEQRDAAARKREAK